MRDMSTIVLHCSQHSGAAPNTITLAGVDVSDQLHSTMQARQLERCGAASYVQVRAMLMGMRHAQSWPKVRASNQVALPRRHMQ